MGRRTRWIAAGAVVALAVATGVVLLLRGAQSAPQDPRGAPPDLAGAENLIAGAEVGAWLPDGGPALDPRTGIPEQVRAAAVPIIRFAAYDCFVGMTCGTDHHPGTLSRADFDSAIRGITGTLDAQLWLKMLPIAADELAAGVDGTSFCPPWTGDASGNLPVYRAVVAEARSAGSRGPLVIESSNEMEYACWQTWQAQGAPITSPGSPGVSRRLGEHYAATMPALKAYARGLGFAQVLVGGYLGIGGGPGWGQHCTREPAGPYGYTCDYQPRWVDEFNVAVHTAYEQSGGDPDVVPDFESIHAYPHSDDFASAPYEFDDRIAYSYYRTWITRSRNRVDAVWGRDIGRRVLFSVSEWNAGAAGSDGGWSGWTSPERVAAFFDGWLTMLAGDGYTTGAGTRYWSANLFVLASNSDTGPASDYNVIRRDGSPSDAWAVFRAHSLALRPATPPRRNG